MPSRYLKYPSQHSGCGGLAVGAAHDDGMFSREKLFLENLRERAMREPAVEHLLNFHIAT
jgi:hypothetical protein